MKTGRFIQYALIMMAIVGVFAAMAQNNYGFDLIGYACFGLSLVFIIHLVWISLASLRSFNTSLFLEIAEPLALAALMVLLGFRFFYIYFGAAEILLSVVLVLLVLVYAWRGLASIKQFESPNRLLQTTLLSFYLSIIFFLVAILIRSTTFSLYLGVLAVTATLPVFYTIAVRKKFEINDKMTSVVQLISKSPSNAGLVFGLLITGAIFLFLTNQNILPSIENVDQPKDYNELVNAAESGNEELVDGEYNHQRYMEAMEKFLERHSSD